MEPLLLNFIVYFLQSYINFKTLNEKYYSFVSGTPGFLWMLQFYRSPPKHFFSKISAFE